MPEDKKWCEGFYRRTTHRNEDGRYVVSLPFSREYPIELQLGLPRNGAISQFKRNESHLLKTRVF